MIGYSWALKSISGDVLTTSTMSFRRSRDPPLIINASATAATVHSYLWTRNVH